MDWLAGATAFDSLVEWSWSSLLAGALAQFATFVLVLLRLGGLFLMGPVFGHATVPVNIRALLAVTLALMLTPLVHEQSSRGFELLDQNGDGRLARHEVPAGLEPEFDRLLLAAHRPRDGQILPEEYQSESRWPANLGEFVVVGVLELCLGVLLSLGVTIVLSGLQTAGQVIDQQAGFGLGQVFNPDFGGGGATAGPLLYMQGLAIFLILVPLGGHLQMLRIVMETFQTLPPGRALVSLSAIELLSGLVQQSLLLAIRVAAPLLVIMSLTDMLMGFLGHSVPQINIQAVGFTVRAVSGVSLLVVTVTTVPDVLAEMLPGLLETWRTALVLPP